MTSEELANKARWVAACFGRCCWINVLGTNIDGGFF
jgi:hypothetical protein